MRRNPTSAVSDTYKLKMDTFKNVQPEDFLVLLRKINNMMDGTGTMTVARQIKNLCIMIHVEALCEF